MKQHCTRKRRIARTVLLILALPLLLLTGYVSTWIAVSKAARENLISSSTALALRPVFAPLIRFSDTEYPGGTGLNRLWWGINPRRVVTKGNVQIEYATSALALAPSDLARREEMGDSKMYPQPVALPQPVSHDASAMRR
jgi:hypothetical protein